MKRFLFTALGAGMVLALFASSAHAWSYTRASAIPGGVSVLGLGAPPAATIACVADEAGANETPIVGRNSIGGYSNGTALLPVPTCVIQLNAWTGPNCAGGALLDQAFVAVSGCPLLPAPPAAPTGLLLLPLSADQIKVSWTDNAINEDAYDINFCDVTAQGAGCDPIVPAGTVGADSTMFTHTLLTAANAYKYQVCARNAGGTSCSVATPTATTDAAPGLPAAPSGLVLLPLSPHAIKLQWLDNSAIEDAYDVFYCDNTAVPGCTPLVLAATLVPNSQMYTHTGLIPDNAYKYRVCARNGSGSTCDGDPIATTFPIPPPTGLGAFALSSSQIELNWTDPDPSQGYGFDIYTCDGPPAPGCTLAFHSSVPGSGNAAVQALIEGLQAASTYDFAVKTTEAPYESVLSNTATETTLIGGQALTQQTGQVFCYDVAGAVIPCVPGGAGQDANATPAGTPAGVPWPSPRYVDGAPECFGGGAGGAGLVFLDKLTNLCYAHDFCSAMPAASTWESQIAASLTACDVGVTCTGSPAPGDLSVARDWRVANFWEATSNVDFQNLGDPVNPGIPTELVTLLSVVPADLICWNQSLWTSTTFGSGDPTQATHTIAWQPGWEAFVGGPLVGVKAGAAVGLLVKDPIP